MSVPRVRHATRGVLEQLRRKAVIGFLLVCTLMEISHSGYHGLFSIHLSENGYSKSLIGPLVALPVRCEIVAMVVADSWLRRTGARWMMGLAFTVAVVRWGVLASTTALIPVAFSQILHSLTCGFFHVTAVYQARRYFPSTLQASAQSLHIGLTYGAGGAIGLLATGRFYDAWGGACSSWSGRGRRWWGFPLRCEWLRPRGWDWNQRRSPKPEPRHPEKLQAPPRCPWRGLRCVG